jgi:hypothetical protein
MAPVTTSPGLSADPSRRHVRGRPAGAVAPPEPQRDAPAALAGHAERHERVRMDLLVARARAARS